MDAKRAAKELAKLGRGNDTVLAHINADEAALLSRLYGGTVNPDTGLPSFGWLQDLSSDFSMKHINPVIAFRDPHKTAEEWFTKGAQSKIGPTALNYVPYVGPFLSAGAKAWLQHEQRKGVYNGQTGQTPIHSGTAGSASVGSSVGSGIGGIVGGYFGSSQAGSTAGGALGGLIGSAFGSNKNGSSGSPVASTATSTAAATLGQGGGNNAAMASLMQQVQQLKQEIQDHYAKQGAGDSDQAKADLARVDAWAAQATQQAQEVAQHQQQIQQEAAQ